MKSFHTEVSEDVIFANPSQMQRERIFLAGDNNAGFHKAKFGSDLIGAPQVLKNRKIFFDVLKTPKQIKGKSLFLPCQILLKSFLASDRQQTLSPSCQYCQLV